MKKTALVTGANSGTGKAAAAALADKGMHVVMLCRSEQRGQQAITQLRQNTSRSLDLMICDLSAICKASVNLLESFKQKYNRLDVLVNNAGVITLGQA